MKKLFASANLVLIIFCAAYAQESTSSMLPLDARFEIVQSPWDKSTTFRLDRYRGSIDRLGTCTKDDTVGSNRCWKEMIVLDLGKSVTSRPHFQITMIALTKSIFMIDNDTGQTWHYGLDATDKWHPFVECSDKTSAQCLWRPLP
jgi:hypothetical protein